MKFYSFVLILINLMLNNNITIFAQEEYSPAVEVFLGLVIGNDTSLISNSNIEFYMNSIGTIWKSSDRYNFSISNSGYKSSLYKPDYFNFPEGGWKGWNAGFLQDDTLLNGLKQIIYGIYRLNTNLSDKYFYLNYRDNRYSLYDETSPIPYGHAADIWIKYDTLNGNFFIKSKGTFQFNEISQGEIINIWELKRKGIPRTDSFPNFWSNCLAAVPNADNNPYVIFGPHPTLSNPNQYQIFRGTNLSDSTDEDYYAQIGFTADSVFIHSDNDVDLSYEDNSVYFFVKAKNSSQLSSRSNIVSIKGRIPWNKTLFLKKIDINPRLLWSKYPDNNATILGYVIKRKTNNNNYIVLDTVDNNVFYYDDLDITMGGGDTSITIKYCVSAIIQGENPSGSNEVTIHIDPEVQKKGHTGLINEFNISQNYPNPFNPTTKINYTIKDNCFVTLKVYDILGKEVALLVNENQNTGSYSVDFSGKNLSAGTYFYEFNAGSFREIKKMILVK